ncbi:MAG TPA: response regulator [Terriglobales bacterium]|nr:response regulator [Terriglobales bacterium]
MSAQCLLLGTDSEALGTLCPVLEELQVAVDVCSRRDAAVQLLSQQKFELLVIDWESVDGPGHVLLSTRLLATNRDTVVLALVSGVESMRASQEMGANFVLSKPISESAARRTLQACRVLFPQEAPRQVRRPVHSLSFVSLEQAQDAAILLNVSEGGMAIQALQPLDRGQVIQFGIELPLAPLRLEARGEIVWVDPSGRAGVRFVEVPEPHRAKLREWLEKSPEEAPASAVITTAESLETYRFPWEKPPLVERVAALSVDTAMVLAATSLFGLVFLVAPAPALTGTAALVTIGLLATLGVSYFLMYRLSGVATPGSALVQGLVRPKPKLERSVQLVPTETAVPAAAPAATAPEPEPVLVGEQSEH